MIVECRKNLLIGFQKKKRVVKKAFYKMKAQKIK